MHIFFGSRGGARSLVLVAASLVVSSLAVVACGSKGSGAPGPLILVDSGGGGQDGSTTSHDARVADGQATHDGHVTTNVDSGDTGVVTQHQFGCNTDANCSNSQHCDTRDGSVTQGECVTCLTSSQCQNSQVCSPVTGECVFDCRLSGSPQCGSGGLVGICDQPSGACVACESNADCAGEAVATLCNTTSHACVQCNSGGDCKDPSAPGCANGQCGRCLSDTNCGGNQSCVKDTTVGTAFAAGMCVCVNNSGCGGKQPVCTSGFVAAGGSRCGCYKTSDCTNGDHCDTLETHLCVSPCLSSSDCTAVSLPQCDTTTGLCVACLTTSDCTNSGGVCDTSTNTCVSCLSTADCAGSLICDPTNTCVACTASSQCAGSANGTACTSAGCACYGSSDCMGALEVDAGASFCQLPTGGTSDAGPGFCSTPP